MRRIEAIILPSRIGKVCTALQNAGYARPRISQIEGENQDGAGGHLLRGKTYRADLMTRAKVEVTVTDGEADRIVEAIRDAAFTGEVRDGKIFVYALEEAYG